MKNVDCDDSGRHGQSIVVTYARPTYRRAHKKRTQSGEPPQEPEPPTRQRISKSETQSYRTPTSFDKGSMRWVHNLRLTKANEYFRVLSVQSLTGV